LNWENQEFLNSKELENGLLALNIPSGNNKLKLNIGSFTVMLHNGWINTDIVNLNDYAAQNQYKFLQMDCRFPLPFENNTVDLIVSSHMLEHLDWNEGLNFLKECYRIMKPNATMRIAVPDTETLFQYYKTNKLEMLDEMNVTAAQNKSQSFKLWSFLFDGHKIAYDFSSLEQIGNEAGFRVERKWFNQGNLEIIKETMDYLPEISIYVEMTKSSNA
jgi:predicted SAM-dependent methyltransferase